LSTGLYWLFIDAVDCLAMVGSFVGCIVHWSGCPIAQRSILLVLLSLQCAQVRVASGSLGAAGR